MLSAVGPAAFWGGAIPAASNATSSNLYEASMPSLPESAMLGLMMRKHTHGMQSGGLVGYSTFFTGYNPNQSGFLRSISIGRLAAQGVSASARALANLTPLGNSALVQRLTLTSNYGLAGAMSAVLDESAFRSRFQGGYTSAANRVGILASSNAPLAGPSAKTQRVTAGAFKAIAGTQGRLPGSLSITPLSRPTPQAIAAAREAGIRSGNAAALGDRGRKAWQWLAGVLGGTGHDARGNINIAGYAEEKLSNGATARVPLAAKGSTGAVWKNPAGMMIGKLARAGAGLQIAVMAADALVDSAGAAYGSVVRTTQFMQDRLAVDHRRMSAGYFSPAAATERQRAVMELNASVLNPRTQLMGNEAYYNHR